MHAAKLKQDVSKESSFSSCVRFSCNCNLKRQASSLRASSAVPRRASIHYPVVRLFTPPQIGKLASTHSRRPRDRSGHPRRRRPPRCFLHVSIAHCRRPASVRRARGGRTDGEPSVDTCGLGSEEGKDHHERGRFQVGWLTGARVAAARGPIHARWWSGPLNYSGELKGCGAAFSRLRAQIAV